MGKIRHKRSNNHVVIVTSDAVDANVKQYHIKSWVWKIITIICCVVIGAIAGYFIYGKDLWAASIKHTFLLQDEANALQEEIARLQAKGEEEKALLNNVIEGKDLEIQELEESQAGLQEQIQILSDTLAKKIQDEEKLRTQLNNYFLPCGFPLTGAATIEEIAQDNPMCVFSTNMVGALVVATAEGTVIAVNTDAEYEQNVWVDHGNGYVTIYRNSGEIKVKQGQTISQGATLFIMGKDDTKLGYQMMKDSVYINPIDMLEING